MGSSSHGGERKGQLGPGETVRMSGLPPAQLVVRVLPITIRVPLSMGSSSHGGERKGQLGPGVTIPMSGLPPEGYPEGSRRVWTP